MRLKTHQPRRRNPNRNRFQSFIKLFTTKTGLIRLGLLAGGIFLGIILLLTFYAVFFLPPIDEADELAFAESTIIYSRNALEEDQDPNDHILYVIHGDENREYVPLSEISQSVIDATLAIEDADFYHHFGFDIGGLVKAFMSVGLGIGPKRGGSTITQQLVKNTFLTREKTFNRKFKELLLAIKVEMHYSKDDILELYLNKIPYGHNAHGIEAAAKTFFGKSSRDLTLAEASILASLPAAPSRFSPFGPNKDLLMGYADYKGENCSSGWCKGRKDLVLEQMLNRKKITMTDFQEALSEAKVIEFKTVRSDIKAPHFVFLVREKIEEKYGKEFLRQGGLRIYTTLDSDIQSKIEEIVRVKTPLYTDSFNAKNVAITVIENESGAILGYIGGKDFFDRENDGQVDVLTSRRQPGSSFKPLVFAAAFEEGLTPGSVLFDVETDFGGNYRPQNFNGKFQGPVNMRQSLNESLNIPSIKAAYLATPKKVLQVADRLGIKYEGGADEHGVALGVGVAEIEPLSHINSFQAFAGDGSYFLPEMILEVQNSKGETLEMTDFEKNKKDGLDPEIAALVRNILTDETTRPTTDDFDWNKLLQIDPYNNGSKTGTSNRIAENPDFDEEKDEDEEENPKFITVPGDSWTVGFTPHLVGGVWVGNNRGEPMRPGATGLAVAAPVWKAVMLESHDILVKKGADKEKLYNEPKPLESRKINKLSGQLITEQTPEHLITEEFFASFSVPTDLDTSVGEIIINRLTGQEADENTPNFAQAKSKALNLASIRPDMVNWQNPVIDWLKEHPRFVTTLGAEMDPDPDEVLVDENGNPIKNSGDLSRWDTQILRDRQNSLGGLSEAFQQKNAPKVTILSPQNGTALAPGQIEVRINARARYGVKIVEYYWNDRIIADSKIAPYTGRFEIPTSAELGTKHVLKVVVLDRLLQFGEAEVEIQIEADTTPPDIKFLGPVGMQRIPYKTKMSVLAEVVDKNSAVGQVELFLDGQLLKTFSQAPYMANFTAEGDLGRHELSIKATDVHGNVAEKAIPIVYERQKLLVDNNPEITKIKRYRSSAAVDLVFPFPEKLEFAELVGTFDGETLFYEKITTPTKFAQIQVPQTSNKSITLQLISKLKTQAEPYFSPAKTIEW